MKKIKSPGFSRVGLILILALAFSCQQRTEVPYPENPSGFEIPKPVAFEMPEGKPFTWKVVPQDSVPKGRTMRYDLDRLPSTPFDLQEEEPLKAPLEVTNFNWDELEEIPFSLEVETDTLKTTFALLPEPIISATGIPLKAENINAGILSLNSGQGLPGSSINGQIIDNNGIHWIGTDQGLIKFTGSEFHLYDIITSDFSGTLNTISDLDLFPDGRILISTFYKGLLILDPDTEIVETIDLPYGFSRSYIDRDGNFWGGMTTPGVKFIDFEAKTLSTWNIPSEYNVLRSMGVFEDSKDNLWIGLSNGIGIVNPEKTSIKLLKSDPLVQSFNIFDFIETSEGDVLLNSFSPGLSIVSLENETVSRIAQDQGFEGAPMDIKLDDEENVWIGSNGYFTIYYPNKSTLKRIETGLNIWVLGQGPPSVSIFDLEGIYWAGTLPNGLLIYDPHGTDSRHFSTDDGLVSNDTWGIMEDEESRVWLATYGGLNIYDPKSKELKYLEIPASIGSNDHRGFSKLTDNEVFLGSVGGFAIINLGERTITSYGANSETALFNWRAIQRPDSTIWIASSAGLLVFDREKGSMKKLDSSSGIAGDTVWGILEDSLGQVWLVSNSGINIIDPENETVKYIGVTEGLLTVDQSALLISPEDEMIIGGSKGISILNKDRTTITHVNRAHGLYPEALYDMIISQGRIQLGTENGIVVIDKPETGSSDSSWRFSNYARAEGYPFSDYNQSTAVATSTGKVWWAASPALSVNLQDPITKGKSVLPPLLDAIQIMDQRPKFFEKENYEAAKDSLLENEMGLNYLVENKITWDSLSNKSKLPIGLTLPHHQNSLTFIYSNSTIKSRDEIEFRYVLEGTDSEWSEVTKSPRSKTYFNLLPGEYTFKVITKDFSGVWSQPTTFSFTILPPWWLTWWAFFLYAFLLGLLIYIIVQVRSSYLKRENKLLEERVNHRTSQLKKSIEDLQSTQEQLIQSEKMASLGELTAGIAHEIQNPLNFVNNFSEVSNELIQEIREEKSKEKVDETLVNELLDDIEKNLSKINLHGKRADSIVKGMLQHSRNSSNEKELTDINLLADEYLRLSYHGLRAKDKSFTAEFELNLDENLPKIEIVPQDIGRVLLNLINNGFYAATEKKKNQKDQGGVVPKVTVSTRKIPEGVEIRVRDNGTGIPEEIRSKIFQPFFTTKPTGAGTGLGLSMSYDIITKGHNGRLEVESKSGEYTEFIIILPN